MSHDPWLILNRLAKDGISSVSVEMKYDGRPVIITDRHLEMALSGWEGTAFEAGPDDDPRAIKAAIDVVALTPEEATDIANRAQAGEGWAQRAYQALVLRELVRFRSGARTTVAKAIEGDKQALATIASIKQMALKPGPGQARARVSAFLLRDALQEAKRLAEQNAKKAPEPAPEEQEEEIDIEEEEPEPAYGKPPEATEPA